MPDNEELIQSIKAERDRLLKKRPALEVERCRVLAEVEKAQFMTFDLKEYVRREYNRQLNSTNEQIKVLSARLKELRVENGQ